LIQKVKNGLLNSTDFNAHFICSPETAN
jgi:hypothetical protein